MREGTQGPPIVNPLNNVVLKFYDVNHFINFLFVLNTALLIKVVVKTSFKNLRCKILHYYFFKNKSLRKRHQDLSLIYIFIYII